MKKSFFFIFLSMVTIFAKAQNQISIHQEQLDYYNSFSEAQQQSMFTPVQMGQKSDNKSCDLNKIVFGYHPYWSNNLETNYNWNMLSDFVYSFWEFSPTTGNDTNSHGWATAASVTAAQNNGARVHLCTNLFNDHATFLNNMTARTNMINNLIAALNLRNAIGVNIDFESVPSANKTNLTAFMIQLCNAVHTAIPGSIVSVSLPAVDWGAVWDIPALINYVDWFVIMGYDYYYSGSSQAGPVSPLYEFQLGGRNLSRSMAYYLNLGVPKERLILAVPYYGREWSTVSNAVPSNTITNISSKFYNAIKNDPVTYNNRQWDPNSFNPYYVRQEGSEWRQCWVDDEQSLARKYDMVNMRDIGGIGIWALGYDDGYTELWDLIENKFSTCAVVPCRDTIYDLGGPTRNYYNNESFNYTIAPTGASGLSLNFTSFALENGWDTLFIYDGSSIASPLVGHYTGSNSPGMINATGNSLTLRFKSDNATVAAGWRAIWQCIQDDVPPTTSVVVNRKWQSDAFEAIFDDADNVGGSGINLSFLQVMDFNGTEWRGSPQHGFFNDNFTSAIHPEWTQSSGSWSISSGHLMQNNESLTNPNIYAMVSQDSSAAYLYHWQMRISGSGTNRRAGAFVFCTDPAATYRGESYMIYFREETNKVEVYKASGGTISGILKEESTPINADVWYDFKVIYDPSTGDLFVFKNDQLVLTWRDNSPLTSGTGISFRTGGCIAEYDDVKVYKSRNLSHIVSVGNNAGKQVRYESPASTQEACRIRTQIIDNAFNWSNPVSENVFIDWTDPQTSSSVSVTWQTDDFQIDFDDTDDLSGVEKRFYQVLDFDGTQWSANTDMGFFCDVMDVPNVAWTAQTGTWNVVSGSLVQSDETLNNTNIWAYLKQDLSNRYLYEFNMNVGGTGASKRVGFHYFCDDPTLDNRGNSYFVWFRLATQKMEFYKVENNVFSLKKSVSTNVVEGQWYNVKIVFDRITGDHFVYLDNSLIGEWNDPSPFPVGSHNVHNSISFRSGSAIVKVNNLKVYRTRFPQVTVSVGDTNKMIRYQNPDPLTHSAKVKSIVSDSAQNLSAIYYHDLNIDWTAPDGPTFMYDGNSFDVDTVFSNTEVSANWDMAADQHSGIAEYYFSIGTAPGLDDVVAMTSNGLSVLGFFNSLNLTWGQTYYFSVFAVNNAGLYSDTVASDGFLVYDITSMMDDIDEAKVFVYPNPAGDEVNLSWRFTGQTTWVLTDVSGKLLKTGSSSSQNTQIQLSEFNAGTYYILVSNGEKIHVVRFLKF